MLKKIKGIIQRTKFYGTIKNFLRRHNELNYLIRCFLLRNNKETIMCVDNPDKVLFIENYSPDITKRPICLIRITESMTGFAAYLKFILELSVFYKTLNCDPYIEITKEEDTNTNFYDLFFLQPSLLNKQDLFTRTVLSLPIDFLNTIKERAAYWYNNDESRYNITDYYIDTMSASWKDFIAYKPDILSRLEKESSQLLKNEKAVAIHFRGTDYRVGVYSHPKALSPSDYFPYIDECINKGYKRFFIATDDELALKEFLVKYPNLFTYYEDTLRSSTDMGVHTQVNNRPNNEYLVKYEIIRDMFTMSKCDGLICGNSNVTIITRIQKKSRNEDWEYFKLIDKGFYGSDKTKFWEHIEKVKNYNASHSK